MWSWSRKYCWGKKQKRINKLLVTGDPAPGALEAVASLLLGAVGQGLVAGRAGGRVLAFEVVLVGTRDHVAGTAAANVDDGGNSLFATHLALELLVEAEDGALAAAVHVAGTATARLEGGWHTRVEASQGSWPCGGQRVGGLGVAQRDDIAGASARGVHGWTARVGHRGVRLNNEVCRRHDVVVIIIDVGGVWFKFYTQNGAEQSKRRKTRRYEKQRASSQASSQAM